MNYRCETILQLIKIGLKLLAIWHITAKRSRKRRRRCTTTNQVDVVRKNSEL